MSERRSGWIQQLFASKNVVGGAVFVLGVVGAATLPYTVFACIVVILATVASYEVCGLLVASHPIPIAIASAVLVVSAWADGLGSLEVAVMVAMLCGVGAGLLTDQTSSWVTAIEAPFVWLYVASPSACLILLRQAEGPRGALIAILYAAVRDIAADLIGRRLGGRPISRANQRKTYRGALVGMVLASISVLPMCLVVWRGDAALTLGKLLLLGVLGQAGDLVESALKRRAGVRHSGRALGGQGGVLDTIDSLLFVAPAVYLFGR